MLRLWMGGAARAMSPDAVHDVKPAAGSQHAHLLGLHSHQQRLFRRAQATMSEGSPGERAHSS